MSLQHESATIVDVARRAQVSVGTVSNVLNGTREVSVLRRHRVLVAIEELGFQRNLVALALRRQSSSVVGLCVPLTSTSYFAALVDAFEEVASAQGFAIMHTLTRHDAAEDRRRVKELLRYRVAGLIHIPSMEPLAAQKLVEKQGVPVVTIDRPSEESPNDQIMFANRPAMRQVGDHLLGLGHRRVLFCVEHPHLTITQDRIAGFDDAIAAAGVDARFTVLKCEPTEPGFRAQMRSHLASDTRPTAMIVSNSMLAAWALRALRAQDLRYPDDLSFLCFGEPDWAELVCPRVSVVRQPTREIAISAWELLMARINGATDGWKRLSLDGEVILRESVGPPPADAGRR